ncbi:tetratricopeptide repeat protein [Ancrocorticia populi]|uniref:Orc1-like AAA ATPase domain-containing protein n=1 Tax=Ancrocorticia populi TaxID=2175228 RepID=A0A2V1K6C1_9ACTO|nr:tetratricopeptide repeat protein [Ancrocorticia populi]PWF26529.1 hypothetical protein DD236_06675 [Ancrocorticia populi]
MRSDVLLGNHGLVVGEILEVLDSVQASKSPQMVVIEGPSGCGKTRIVQEFYGRLKDRNQDAYWPPLRKSQGNDVMRQRKLIGPLQEDLLWPEETFPTFGWWHFNCETLGTGILEDVVAAARPQVDANGLPLTMARRKNEGLLAKGKRQSKAAWSELTEAARDEGVSAAVDVLAENGIEVLFPESLLSFGIKGLRAGNRRRKERAQFKNETDTAEIVSKNQATAGKDLAKAIADLALDSLPAIVVVEDLHRMGNELSALLDSLLASNAPVLVIATNWPDAVSNNIQSAFISNHKDSLVPIECPQLGHSDLTQLVQESFDVSLHIAEETARRLDNPLVLKLWLESSELADSYDFIGPEALLTDHAGLPIDALGVLDARWGELDRETQMALCLATAARPDEAVPLCDVEKEILAEAFAQFSPGSEVDVAAGLDKAISPMHWCASPEFTVRFIDVVFADHARYHSEKRLRGNASRKFQTITRGILADSISQPAPQSSPRLPNQRDLALARRSHLAVWFLELDAELKDQAATPGLEYARSRAELQLSELTGGRMEFAASSEHAAAALKHLRAAGITGTELLNMQLAVADKYILVSKPRSAQAIHEEILQHENLPSEIAMQIHLSSARIARDEGDFEEAAGHQRQAIELARTIAGPEADKPGMELQRLTSLYLRLEQYLAAGGNWEEIITELSPVLDKRLQVGYPTNELNNGQLKRLIENARRKIDESKGIKVSAEEEQRAMLDAAISLHGSDSERVHAERNKLASVLGKAKKWTEAAEEYEWVISHWHQSRYAAYGESKATAYRSLAQVQEALGQKEAAIESYRRAISLSTKNNVETGFWPRIAIPRLMAGMGQVDDALTQLDQIVEEFETPEGDTWLSLSALEARTEILQKEKRFEEAEAGWRRALTGWSLILGDLSDRAADCRKNLIEVLETQGKFDAAIELLQNYIELEEKEYGKETTPSINAKIKIGNAYAQSDRPADALPWFQEARAGIVAIRGSDHPAVARMGNGIRVIEARLKQH